MKKPSTRNREKLYITISPLVKKRAMALAKALGISASRLIEDALGGYMEKYGIRSTPTIEQIARKIKLVDDSYED